MGTPQDTVYLWGKMASKFCRFGKDYSHQILAVLGELYLSTQMGAFLLVFLFRFAFRNGYA